MFALQSAVYNYTHSKTSLLIQTNMERNIVQISETLQIIKVLLKVYVQGKL
jgi:hypothetical protein